MSTDDELKRHNRSREAGGPERSRRLIGWRAGRLRRSSERCGSRVRISGRINGGSMTHTPRASAPRQAVSGSVAHLVDAGPKAVADELERIISKRRKVGEK